MQIKASSQPQKGFQSHKVKNVASLRKMNKFDKHEGYNLKPAQILYCNKTEL